MSTNVILPCAAGCGAEQSAQTYVGPDKQPRPLQVHPYICLACWRAGWRHEAPKDDRVAWHVYQLKGHPQ